MKILTLTLPPIMTNCYIVYEKEGGSCIIIDPASSADSIKNAISKKNLSPKLILLTHGHFDHIGAADNLKNEYKIPVCVHTADAKMITSDYMNSSSLMGAPVKLDYPDKLLNDGDVITLENESLEVIHTPGHTEGSCVFLTDNFIISGDTIFQGSYGRYDLYGGNYEALMKSITKVLSLKETLIIYAGHGNTTTIAKEREMYI